MRAASGKEFGGIGVTPRQQRAAAAPGSGRWPALPVLLLLLPMAAFLLLALGEADAGAADTPISTPRAVDPPLAPGPVPDLDLLFTAEVAGWIEPCG